MIESSEDRPREPWERLLDEPDRAYSAFECYLSMPLGERSFEEAYRIHAGNPHATGPSDTFKQWTKSYDWRKRAAAWDDAVRRARRDGVLEGTKDQWGKMTVELERMHADLMHLSESAYLKALEIFEQRLTPENHTLAHAVQMSKLVLEIYKHSSDLQKIHGPQDPWPEISDEELDQIFDGLLEEFGANSDKDGAEEAQNGPG